MGFDENQLVSDTLFQITYSLIHNDSTITPFTIGIAEAVHDTCRSKKLIMMLQKLGLCKSYESLQSRDTALAERLVDQVGNNSVPVPPIIHSDNVIYGAMDNFEKEDGTHDTILMLFQNHNFAENVSLDKDISSIRMKSTKRKLQTNLPCQELLV